MNPYWSKIKWERLTELIAMREVAICHLDCSAAGKRDDYVVSGRQRPADKVARSMISTCTSLRFGRGQTHRLPAGWETTTGGRTGRPFLTRPSVVDLPETMTCPNAPAGAQAEPSGPQPRRSARRHFGHSPCLTCAFQVGPFRTHHLPGFVSGSQDVRVLGRNRLRNRHGRPRHY